MGQRAFLQTLIECVREFDAADAEVKREREKAEYAYLVDTTRRDRAFAALELEFTEQVAWVARGVVEDALQKHECEKH